jgi:hypothetical protein
LLYEHLPAWTDLSSDLRQLFPDRTITKIEAGVGPKGATLTLETATSVAAGLASQSKISGGENAEKVSPATIKELSIQSVNDVNRVSAIKPGPIATILWVDPHPANNIGLQYAFQWVAAARASQSLTGR